MPDRKFISPVDHGGQQVHNMADGSAANHGATYGQLLNLLNGKDYKDGVVAASTGNVNIASPGATFDGVSPSVNDRIFLGSQTTASQNGIWLWKGATSPLVRPADFTGNTGIVTQGATVVIDGGTQAGQQWTLTTTGNINVDTTALTFTRTTAVGQTYTAAPGGGLVLSAGAFSIDPAYKVVRSYAAALGDGTATSFVVNHNLGTRDVKVQLYSAASPYDEVDTYVEHTDANNVTVYCAVAPTAGQYRVVVQG